MRCYSTFRTEHQFKHLVNITNVTQISDFLSLDNKDVFILGNGSNVLFKKHFIKTTILKNSLPQTIEKIDVHTYLVSSSCSIQKVLARCYKEKRDSFYYLSSVPATIGGAVAMNAGEVKNINKPY